MNFNNAINHLNLWCEKKAEAYHEVHGAYGGGIYVGYLIAYELQFKLQTLMDKSFEDTEAFKKEVLALVDIHYEPAVLNPQNSLVQHIIDKIGQEFCEFLEEVVSKQETLPLADMPYTRVIVGSEANALQDKFRFVWRYEANAYWYPLEGDAPKEIPEKFFIMLEYLKPYIKQLEKIIGLPETHIYSYGESTFRPPNCLETAQLTEYDGCETIFTDKAFTWAIYFSHESTVAFAGSIVPMVKDLLSKEKEHWNRFEADW